MNVDLSQLRQKKILITGASGFIGQRLCEKLTGLGCTVHGVARDSGFDLENDHYIHHSVDLVRRKKVRSLVWKVKPDLVIHLAGLSVGHRSVEAVPTTFEGNLKATLNLLIEMAELGYGRILLAGSLEEPEGDLSNIPSSPYAVSKWAATRYAMMFHALYKTAVVHLRIFMVYGPGQDENKLVPYVINKLLDNDPPKLTSGVREIDWIYIDDVVDGIIHAAIAPGIEGKSLDIGTGSMITTKNLVEKVANAMQSNTELLFGELKDRKMEQVRRANVQRTEKLIGWKSTTSLDEGLTRTIAYFERQNAQN